MMNYFTRKQGILKILVRKQQVKHFHFVPDRYSFNFIYMLQPNFTPFPELTTGRLLLRRLTLEDSPAVFLSPFGSKHPAIPEQGTYNPYERSGGFYHPYQ